MAEPPPLVEPYVPASSRLPELTIGVVVLGSVLSVLLAAANAYLGMFAGLTVSASVLAAVLSMGIFRVLRRGNILQNNAVQTAAASGEGLAAGVIFTLLDIHDPLRDPIANPDSLGGSVQTSTPGSVLTSAAANALRWTIDQQCE